MKRKLCVLMATVALLVMTVPGSLAVINGGGVSATEVFSKSADSGSEITFSKDDFVSHMAAGTELDGIILTQMPTPEAGILKCGARDMLAGEAIVAGALDELRFIPAGRGDVTASFSFLPVFDGRVDQTPVTVGLKLASRPNRPPTATNITIVTYKNTAIAKPFKGSDPDGDPLTYKVTGKPRRGTVEVLEDGAFRYTPYQNKTGADSFTYAAVDPHGNVSSDAKVDIQIEKPGTKLSYADMDDHPNAYAALKLHEIGVFTGEKMGHQYYFRPDRLVTRGEFITMVMSMLGQDSPPRVLQTGFSDDDATPVWVRPYAAAALKAGIVRGVSLPDGRRELRADHEITRAETAVILNNALKSSDADIAVFSDWDAAPVWARQPAVNMQASGVMDSDYEGAMRLDNKISRADAAELLLAAMEVKEKDEPKRGLLSWVFG